METRQRITGFADLSGAERSDRLVFAAFQLPFTGLLVAAFVRDNGSSALRWCISLSWFVGLLALFEAREHVSVVRAARRVRELGRFQGQVPEAELLAARRRMRRALFETLLGTLLLTSLSVSL